MTGRTTDTGILPAGALCKPIQTLAGTGLLTTGIFPPPGRVNLASRRSFASLTANVRGFSLSRLPHFVATLARVASSVWMITGAVSTGAFALDHSLASRLVIFAGSEKTVC